MHYVYILQLSNAQLYTGRTSNLKRRLTEHKRGSVKATRHRRPVQLLHYEAFESKDDGIRREKYLKTAKGKSTVRLMLRESLKK